MGKSSKYPMLSLTHHFLHFSSKELINLSFDLSKNKKMKEYLCKKKRACMHLASWIAMLTRRREINGTICMHCA
jgi:hypothetical protein